MKRRRRRQTAQPPRQPATTRITKQLEDPGATEHETPAWLFRDADQNGPWPLTEEAFLKHIMPKLRDFETMTWAQIKRAAGGRRYGTNHHSLSIADDLGDGATVRARKLRLGVDELFSLRLTGKRRLIGIRSGRHFKVLWYDPEHEVAKRNKGQ